MPGKLGVTSAISKGAHPSSTLLEAQITSLGPQDFPACPDPPAYLPLGHQQKELRSSVHE